MKKYGFLLGAGAELAYNLPSGGQFALYIFRQDKGMAVDDKGRSGDKRWADLLGEVDG